MSQETKSPPPETSSSPSRSDSPSPARSLALVLGAIDKTIKSFEIVLRSVHDEVKSQGVVLKAVFTHTEKQDESSLKRHEHLSMTLSKMLLEVATLAEHFRTFVTSHSIQLGASVETKAAIERARASLEKAAKDITGSHATMTREKDEEKNLLEWRYWRLKLMKVADAGWPHALKFVVKVMVSTFGVSTVAQKTIDWFLDAVQR